MKEGRRKEEKKPRHEIIRAMLANATCPLKEGQKYPTPYRGHHDDETIGLALKDTTGNYARAAVLLGVTRATVANRIASSDYLQDIMEDIEGTKLDAVEEALYGNALFGDSKAQIFLMQEKGKDRGYGDKGAKQDDSKRKLELFLDAVERVAQASSEIRALAAPEPEPIEVECRPVEESRPEVRKPEGDDLW